MKTAIVYTSKTCPYCKFAITFLKENGVRVVTKDINNKKYAKELVDKTKQYGIPIIENQQGKFVVGYEEDSLRKLFDLR